MTFDEVAFVEAAGQKKIKGFDGRAYYAGEHFIFADEFSVRLA